jgi:hypothetical protein
MSQRARTALVPLFLVCFAVAACESADVGGDFDYRKSRKNATLEEDAGSKKSKSTPDKPQGNGNNSNPPSTPAPSPQDDTPVLSSLSPESVTVGSQGFELVLSGMRFKGGLQVEVGTTKVTSTLSNPAQLRVTVPADLVKTPGMLPITVLGTNGSRSNSLSLTVANPQAVSITSLSPASAPVGSQQLTVAISGTGFIQTSIARFNGAALPTTYQSGTQLSAVIPAASLENAGKFSVVVANSDQIISVPSPFEVRNPAPTVASVAPATVEATPSALGITLTGTGFVRTSEAYIGNTPLGAVYMSPTQLRATIPAGTLQTAGAKTITVRSPEPGGGASGNITLNVTAPANSSSSSTGGTTQAAYKCVDYDFATYECFDGWYCKADGLLEKNNCAPNGIQPPSTANQGGNNCVYKCVDYGYQPNQCQDGWICLASGASAGCLGQIAGGCP